VSSAPTVPVRMPRDADGVERRSRIRQRATERTDVPVSMSVEAGFIALGVPAPLAEVLTATGIIEPFPIQAATLPDSLAGRDVLGRGRTGSGKTLAFSIPLVARLCGARTSASRPRGLVLVPTRELANQVLAVLTPLAGAVGLRATAIYGGVGQNPQVKALQSGVDIIVACPGRLNDLVRQGHCRLDAVEVTVLDEADHMADLGFLPDVRRLLDTTPKKGQRLLFSATLDRGVDVLVRRYLQDPVTHSVDAVEAPVSAMDHHVLSVTMDDKPSVVRELAAGLGRTVMFTRTKHQASRLAKQLTDSGIPAVDLHGNLSQNARQRNLAAFGSGTTRVLVATDIAARGIHIDDVTLVVHVDPPAEHKAYLHRSGRTARAGAAGTVVTITTPAQAGEMRTLARKAGINPTVSRVTSDAAMVTQLRGERAPHVTPAPAAPVRQAAPRRRSGYRR
jgi:superfamily II DNA/RNA helicase